MVHNRSKLIEERLIAALEPAFLSVVDTSVEHQGHAGHQGAGHFVIEVQAACLSGLTRVAQHREIYTALQDLMPKEIHALSIKVLP